MTADQPPAGQPDQPTMPQTWPEQPTVPVRAAPGRPVGWPPQPPPWAQPSPWPQQPATWQAGWPPQGAGPGPGQAAGGAAGRDRYAVRPPPVRYQQQYEPRQQIEEWSPMPLPAQDAHGMVVAPKNPAVSVLLSVFIPGLGSMVNDNVGVGVAILVLNIIGWILAIVLIGLPLAIGTWIWGLVDAHQSAQRWNRAHGIIS
jgi:TM2 domain-containing membrane protein YozV